MCGDAMQIEENVKPGKYNELAQWRFADVAKAFDSSGEQVFGMRATTIGELQSAFEQALALPEKVGVIDAVLPVDSYSPELETFGKKLAEVGKQ
jgi:TPP-dependent 2-oxoacid decarboxylase